MSKKLAHLMNEEGVVRGIVFVRHSITNVVRGGGIMG